VAVARFPIGITPSFSNTAMQYREWPANRNDLHSGACEPIIATPYSSLRADRLESVFPGLLLSHRDVTTACQYACFLNY